MTTENTNPPEKSGRPFPTPEKKLSPKTPSRSAGRKSARTASTAVFGRDLFEDDFDDVTFFDEELLSLEEFESMRFEETASEAENAADEGIRDVETTSQPALPRRDKVRRRRQIDPTTCERHYTEDELEFMNALDQYKRNSGRMFPTCSEMLEVFRSLGYVKMPTETAEE